MSKLKKQLNVTVTVKITQFLVNMQIQISNFFNKIQERMK